MFCPLDCFDCAAMRAPNKNLGDIEGPIGWSATSEIRLILAWFLFGVSSGALVYHCVCDLFAALVLVKIIVNLRCDLEK